jgi:hypothetical protein
MASPPKKDPHTEGTRRAHFESGRRTEVNTSSMPSHHKIKSTPARPMTSGGKGSSRKYAKGTHRHRKTT